MVKTQIITLTSILLIKFIDKNIHQNKHYKLLIHFINIY